MATSLLHRAVRSAGAIAVATTALVAGICLPAQAVDVMVHSDDMEPGATSPWDRFWFESNSESSAGSFQDATRGWSEAHSGSWSAMLSNVFADGSWVSVGQDVWVPAKWGRYPTTCQFGAYVYGDPGASYNLEVLNPTTYAYVALKRVQPSTGWTFTKVTTNKFSLPFAHLVLRVSYLTPGYGSTAFVDDFKLQCTYL